MMDETPLTRRLQIQHARIIDPLNNVDEVRHCYLEDGKILATGQTAPEGYVADKTIDATGLWLMPGLVDLSAYLREPGQEQKATIATETWAAAKSGITTLCYQPEANVPVNNTANVNLIHEINQRTAYANIEVLGNLTRKFDGETLSNMGGLKKAGCIGVGNGIFPIKNLNVLRMAMKYAATHDLTVFLHPLNHALMNEGCMHEGALSSRLGLPGIPVAAETAALASILMLVADTGVKTHICRLSSGESIRLLAYAKKEGLPITSDVAAHQLWLTEQDVSDFNPLCHVLPPLRSQRDRDMLREAVADGLIDVICSDHQPHEIDAKLAPFQQTEAGISALESFLPLTYKLVEDEVLSLDVAIKAVTSTPAAIINRACGSLNEGNEADLILFDPKDYWHLEANSMLSSGKNTPFSGWSFTGKVKQTFISARESLQ
jgi:dihydroorotase